MATDFEGHTHEQLLAMIASIDPGTVTVRAAQLSNAAKAIEEIGESLKRHRVRGWDGEAADAFQDWVSRAGNATLRLAEYGAEAGRCLTEAAQTMIEVKANTPPYDTAAAANLRSAHEHHNDPDAREAARTAHSTLDADHERAIQQLTKLAQSYEASATQLTRAQIPTFPPPPGAFEPERLNSGSDLERSSGCSTDLYVGSPAHAGNSPKQGGVADGPPRSGGSHFFTAEAPSMSPPGNQDRDVEVSLDHITTLPDRVIPPTVSTPGGVGSGGYGAAPLVFVPPLPFALPGVGGGVLPSSKPPGTGVGPVGGSTLPVPHGTGIVGGRPLSANVPGAGIPRGTVIGADGTPSVGRGVGGGFSSAAPGNPAPVPARRPVMEPGAVVGGRQSTVGNQPFTQGGSGLVRGALGPGTVGGAMGHGGASAQAQGSRRSVPMGIRPDYLTEDEETWQNNHRVVPPVID
ncbi:WXG100 family type VII secretion target [Streptomyces sp. NPDC090054]|uniref:WXG100 family type VII secretion target n=1 Tax=Streptomyces sp. NPDC090054 TaxID=3365933 RepID=UPI00382E4DAA